MFHNSWDCIVFFRYLDPKGTKNHPLFTKRTMSLGETCLLIY